MTYLTIVVENNYSDMNSKGVHLVVSAFGIHFLFIGVSKVIGKIEATKDPAGRPLPSEANDFVNWCTEAFASPYPIMPGNIFLLVKLKD